MFKTINAKFIIFTTIFILLSVGIPTVFLIYQMGENFDQRSRIMLKSTLDVVYSSLIDAMRLGNQKHLPTILDNIAKNEGVDHIRIFARDGGIKFSSIHAEVGQNITTLAPGHVNTSLIDHENIRLLGQDKIYSMTRPIQNEPECQECHGSKEFVAYLDVDTDLTEAEIYFYTGSMHMIFLAIAIVIILFFGFYFLFQYFINRPLSRFKTALDNVEHGNLNVQLPAKKEDEFGTLESHFNHMVTNLRESKRKIEEMHFEQLQRADKLVTLGELAAEMAHEINNPAGIIMSRVDYVQMDMNKNPGLQKYNEDLDVVINQIKKISKITSSILKYSKKLPKDFQAINLQEITDESLAILGPRLAKKRIQIEKSYHAENTEIMGDPVQMEQVFTNLVNNAIDAMDDGGKIIIGLDDVNRNHITWFIRDNGSGMDQDIKSKIFSPFFTTKAADKGTGLGLYIVKNICKNHNAEVECESQPDNGTTFRINFLKKE